jgi:hypothetical protein
VLRPKVHFIYLSSKFRWITSIIFISILGFDLKPWNDIHMKMKRNSREVRLFITFDLFQGHEYKLENLRNIIILK